MKNFITLLALFITTGGLFAQKQANQWQFGERAGLNFNNDTVVAQYSGYRDDGTQAVTQEGVSSIADANGQLLFYTNGQVVFNRFDSLMPNGTGLLADNSSTQAALIVPTPGNANQYYIFTTDLQAGPNGFRYSLVDMTLDNGKGDVTTKNIKLQSSVDEKLSAVSSADNGYWVMVHEFPGDGFYAYKITASGINTTPVISHAGIVHTNNSLINTNGQMKFSHDGTQIALAVSGLDVVDIVKFNDSTGVASSFLTIGNVTSRPYGLEFSSDDTKLYITRSNDIDGFNLDQFDLSSNDSATIVNSQTPITSNDGTVQLRQLQLGTNKKIYVAVAYPPYVSAINAPDSAGIACNYQDNVVNLDPANTGLAWCRLGLPNFVQSLFRTGPRAEFNGIDTFICPGTCINFTDLSRNRPTSWEWHFPFAHPDTSTQQNPQNICYPSGGNYRVTLIVGNGTSFDTVVVNNAVKVYPLPSISVVEIGDTLTVFGGTSYQWYHNGQPIPGATDSVYIASPDTGAYAVRLTDPNGCSALSSPIKITGVNDLLLQQVSIYPNPTTDGWQITADATLTGSRLELFDIEGRKVFQSELSRSTFSINLPLARGMYLLRITTRSGDNITRKLSRL